MRDRSVADRWRPSERPSERTWLTTADAARMLQVSTEGVRGFVRAGHLACEWTLSGQRLFRPGHVLRLVEQRAEARLRSRAAVLRAVRCRMLHADLPPRQLSLDFRARLKLVGSRGNGRKVA